MVSLLQNLIGYTPKKHTMVFTNSFSLQSKYFKTYKTTNLKKKKKLIELILQFYLKVFPVICSLKFLN